MRDVLGTIQADQDAIIRAGSGGALVVDGGPGTGKTVVALHRTAYLLYSDPRLGHRQGGVLFVGPHQPYLAYVADVLPSLGEEEVQTCTLRDLVAEGAARGDETDPGGGPAEVVGRAGDGDRGRGPVLRGAAHDRDDRPGRRRRPPAERRRLGRGVPGAGPGHPAQRGPRRGLGRTAHDPARQIRRRRAGDLAAPVTARKPRLAYGVQPRLAPARGHRPGRGPVVGARLPAQMCAVARRGRRTQAAAGPAARLDHRGPAVARRGAAAPRRPGVVASPAPGRSRARDREPADGARPRRPARLERLRRRRGPDDHAARAGHADLAGRRGGAGAGRTGSAGRPVRAHRRRRGAGTDRRGVADAAAALPGPQFHHRRRPRAGPARLRASRGGNGWSGSAWSGSPWPR